MQKENTTTENSKLSETTAEILLKKQCEHAKCPHSECTRKDLKYGGIDI
jgi:hypothetical protein